MSISLTMSFSEKLMKFDIKRREYDIIVIGEEAHLAYNRVGLTSFFQHRKVENLYLNPEEWVCLPHSMLASDPWLIFLLVISTRACPKAPSTIT